MLVFMRAFCDHCSGVDGGCARMVGVPRLAGWQAGLSESLACWLAVVVGDMI